MKNPIRHIAILLAMLAATGLQAQTGNPADDELDPERIDIVKPFEPILADAYRLQFTPDLPSKDDLPNRGEPNIGGYDVPNRLLSISYEPPTLTPLAYSPSKNKGGDDGGGGINHFRLLAGYGLPGTPIFDLAANTGKSEKIIAGLTGSHVSTNGKTDFKNFSDTRIGAFSKFFVGENYAQLDAGYKRFGTFFYGYDRSDSTTLEFTDDDLKQVFNTISVGAGLGSTDENDARLEYDFRVDYHNHRDKMFACKENNILLGGDAKVLLGDHVIVGGTIASHFSNYTDTVETQNNLALNLTPKFTYRTGIGDFTGGLSILFDGNEIYPFPYLAFEIFAVPNRLAFYGLWSKELVKNNFMNLSEQNPWIGPALTYRNTRKDEWELGLKGSITKDLSYNFKVHQAVAKEMMLFVNDTTDMKQFGVVYDPKTKFWGLQAELGYEFSDRFKTSLLFDFNKYNTQEQARAWNLHTTQLTWRGSANPIEKLWLGADLFTRHGAKARLADGNEESLKGALDLNAAAKYALIKNISLFCNANNILSIQHERFLNYPTYGFNIVGGVIVKL